MLSKVFKNKILKALSFFFLFLFPLPAFSLPVVNHEETAVVSPGPLKTSDIKEPNPNTQQQLNFTQDAQQDLEKVQQEIDKQNSSQQNNFSKEEDKDNPNPNPNPDNPDDQKTKIEQEVLANKEDAQKPNKEDKVERVNLKEIKKPIVNITGDIRVGGAYSETGGDWIWKDANAIKQGVPQEKSYFYLWGPQRYNTYDKKVYSGVRFNFDTNFNSPWQVHSQIAIDPWTFVGVSQVACPRNASMDKHGNIEPDPFATDWVNIKLKYWSNSGYTLDESYRSIEGNIVTIPEIKVIDGQSDASWGKGAGEDWGSGVDDHWGAYQIYSRNIHYYYRPVREFFVNYQEEDTKFRLFMMGYQDQAYTSDDPLHLSNNHVWWEESPWLGDFEPSVQFSRTDNPITRARWGTRYAYASRDSELQRLVFLRGVRFNASLSPSSTFDFVTASPMTLWDEYQNADTINNAMRFKTEINDNLTIGWLATNKIGLNRETIEGENYLQSQDYNYRFSEGRELYGQFARSYSRFYQANRTMHRYDGYGYMQGLKFDKLKVYWTYLDKKFNPGLSNYRYTREDLFYGRHINFFQMYHEDAAIRIGDSIDVGRHVGGMRYEDNLCDDKLQVLWDYRNAHKYSGKYIETIIRLETTTSILDKFSIKTLCWYRDLPLTTKGLDPLINTKNIYSLTDYFSDRDEPVENAKVEGGKNPSIGHFSIGGKYDATKWLSFIPIYECTNDPVDFPRSLLNNTYYRTVWQEGVAYDELVPYLYDQGFFELPPYKYYTIIKFKTVITPKDNWNIFLTYTKNTNKYETGIDDNVNHVGFETDYRLNSKWKFWFRYMCTSFIDLYMQVQTGELKYDYHNNFFVGARYTIDATQYLDLLYGESVGYDDMYRTGRWSLTAMDTQHIIRITYKRKF